MKAPFWLMSVPIAHRGLHNRDDGIVENSLRAASAAIAKGFAIECDVQPSKDGCPMVFHDDDLERLTGKTGNLGDMKADALKRLSLTGGGADTIPDLQSLLALVAGQVPLVVEIKSRFDGDMRLARNVFPILQAYSGPVAIKSFDPAVVALAKTECAAIVRGIVSESRHDDPEWNSLSPAMKRNLAELLHFEATEPNFLSWNQRDLPCAPVYLCRQLAEIPTMSWTVRSPEERTQVLHHADQIVFEGFIP